MVLSWGGGERRTGSGRSRRLRTSTLKVWDVDSGRELRTLTGHTMLSTAVAVMPDGQRRSPRLRTRR